MKALLLASVLLSFFLTLTAEACSCSYDYDRYNKEMLNKAAQMIGVATAKEIQINEYYVKYTAMAPFDPFSYGRRSCGCTSFVKRYWEISYNKGQEACEAKIVLPVYNNNMKIKDIVCR